MQFYSTRNHSHNISFKEALFYNLAPDGGLYMPVFLPKLSANEIESMRNKSLQEIAYLILEKFIDNIATDELRKIVRKSYSFPINLKKVGDYYYLELFHGPTMAFKDVGVGTLARLMEHIISKNKKKIMILTATSGDTGGAVAQAFSNLKNVKAVILFPGNQISKLQEEQITKVANNIYPVSVKGTFDDCQGLVKTIFQKKGKMFGGYELISANSINIGRLLPQVVYYFYATLKFKNKKIRFVVPSGNMGNITAGIIAKKMGAPIHSFIVACNANDPVVTYYKTGKYTPKKSVRTLSNAMDIGSPNNFERVLDLYNNDHKQFKLDIKAVSISDEETIDTIKKIYQKYDYLIDPHTAVAVKAGEKLIVDDLQDIIVATASAEKFRSEIKKSTGITVKTQTRKQVLDKYKKRLFKCNNSSGDLRHLLKSC